MQNTKPRLGKQVRVILTRQDTANPTLVPMAQGKNRLTRTIRLLKLVITTVIRI